MTLLWRSALSTSTKELVLLPKFDNSRGAVEITWDKEICHMITSWWHHYHLRNSTQWNPFNDVNLLSKFDVSSFFVTWDVFEFSNWSFCCLWAVQSWCSICYLWASQNRPYLFPCTDFGQFRVILLSLGKTWHEKQPKPSQFDKN